MRMKTKHSGSLSRMRFGIGLAALLAAMAFLAPRSQALLPSPTTCTAVTTIATVCSLGSCATTYYVDHYWCSRTPGTDRVPDPHHRNPADVDQDLYIDDHKDVVKTSDPCAWQFDLNDRLGSEHGGPNNTPGRENHTGVDIQANRGDPVGVVKHGYIERIGYQVAGNPRAGCGYRIVVNHVGGDTSVYCHLVGDSSRYQVGDWVRAGTVIGQANSTGNSSGDHLHLIYWKDGKRIEYWDVTGTKPSSSELSGSC